MAALFTLLMLAFVERGPNATLEVDVQGLRSPTGLVQACLTSNRRRFPDCKSDPASLRRTVQAGSGKLIFTGIRPGNYALALFHDQNANGKLDTVLGIPREGFGFSRNPKVRFGAPRYEQCNMEFAPGFTRLRVRVQYLL